ncbi:MAG TPA: sigma-70 family RNA polymerase sigma factor [Pyrinomonadaceae bacterium]|nr:sigma-70 family RNA polymerase sigma factor [Pyrinomonadaceae bacterium]
MDETQQIAKLFENHRRHLQAVAYRMLGSAAEADDAVQEAWLRLSRSDVESIENMQGWLTTVVARVCLDMLRSRKSRREEALEDQIVDATVDSDADPEREALMADSVGIALLVMLDTLTPAERVAFVLHDVFDLPFDEIAPIVGRTPAAARQLASRARRRVRSEDTTAESDLKSQRVVVDAFLSALRAGDFAGLLAVLDPDVIVRLGPGAGAPGAPSEIRGAENWARGAVAFSHLAQSVQPALIDGAVGLVFAPHGSVTRALLFTIADERIVGVEIIAAREQLDQLDVAVLTD